MTEVYIQTQASWVHSAASEKPHRKSSEFLSVGSVASGGVTGTALPVLHLRGNVAQAQLWVPVCNSNSSSYLPAMETEASYVILCLSLLTYKVRIRASAYRTPIYLVRCDASLRR